MELGLNEELMHGYVGCMDFPLHTVKYLTLSSKGEVDFCLCLKRFRKKLGHSY